MILLKKILTLIILTLGGMVATYGGNLILAPWFGENPDKLRLPWFDIWKYEMIVFFIVTLIYVFIISGKISQKQILHYKNLFLFTILFIILGVFVSPILAGITMEYIIK